MQQTGEVRDYYIAFTDGARLNWFLKLFTKKNFEHCEIYMALAKDCSVSLCQTLENVEVTAYKHPIKDVIAALKHEGAKVLYLRRVKKKRRLRYGIMIPSCVSHCMITTGLSFNCLSVYGYYKALLKSGAIEI